MTRSTATYTMFRPMQPMPRERAGNNRSIPTPKRIKAICSPRVSARPSAESDHATGLGPCQLAEEIVLRAPIRDLLSIFDRALAHMPPKYARKIRGIRESGSDSDVRH